jgi:hypothetical protein
MIADGANGRQAERSPRDSLEEGRLGDQARAESQGNTRTVRAISSLKR